MSLANMLKMDYLVDLFIFLVDIGSVKPTLTA